MQINFTGHHIEITPPLKTYAEDKLERILRHFDRIIKIDFTFEIEKLQQIVRATVFVSGAKLHAESKSDDMYKAIDLLVDKLDRQIKEHKDKEIEHR